VGRKNIIYTYKMLDAVALDTSSDSTATVVTTIDHASINITWTGGAGGTDTGVVVVQVTNLDSDASTFAASDWVDLTLSGGAINLTGTSGEHLVIFDKIPFRAMRLSYTNSDHSSGTLTAILSAKTIGA